MVIPKFLYYITHIHILYYHNIKVEVFVKTTSLLSLEFKKERREGEAIFIIFFPKHAPDFFHISKIFSKEPSSIIWGDLER